MHRYGLSVCGLGLVLAAALAIGSAHGSGSETVAAAGSLAVPEAVQAYLDRIRTPAEAGVDIELPDEWREVAEIRAAQSGRPVAEMLNEVRKAYQQAQAHPPPAQKGGASILGIPTPIIRVGNDTGGCDFFATATIDGLQQAIDAAAGDANGADLTEIRVANSGDYAGRRYFVNDPVGGDQSVEIVGGYALCGSAAPTGITTLDPGGASGQVMQIQAAVAGQDVFLENLRLQGGTGTNGGGLLVGDNNFVVGTSLIVSGNTAAGNGGGIFVADSSGTGSTNLWLMDGSSVAGNTAANGGGIFCTGSVSVFLDALVGINSNTATNSGGGFYLLDGCGLLSFASLPVGIFVNTAGSDGGGGYIAGGAEVELFGGADILIFGDATRPTTLDGNRADRSGGGLYAVGAGSIVRALDSWIANNTANADGIGTGGGGGVALAAGASFFMDRTLVGDACHSADRCSRLANNSALAGGAVDARGNGVNVDIRQTWIEDNQADSLAAAVLVSNSGGDPAQPGALFMEGNMIVNNPASMTDTGGLQGVVDVQSNTDTTIAFTTFADNLTSASGRDLIAFNDADVTVFSSIFRESTGQVYSANWDPDTRGIINCTMVHETGSLPPGPSENIIEAADPQFIAPGAGGDYHVAGTSPAVDQCEDSITSMGDNDIDGQARGFDDPGIPNVLGPYDLGADEFVRALNGGTVQFATAVAEVMEDAGPVTLTVNRVGGSEGATSFRVQTASGSASSGSDFNAVNQLLNWAGGDSSSRTVNITINNDAAAESFSEDFTVTLSQESGSATLGSPAAVAVTIFDNETVLFADGFEGEP